MMELISVVGNSFKHCVHYPGVTAREEVRWGTELSPEFEICALHTALSNRDILKVSRKRSFMDFTSIK